MMDLPWSFNVTELGVVYTATCLIALIGGVIHFVKGGKSDGDGDAES